MSVRPSIFLAQSVQSSSFSGLSALLVYFVGQTEPKKLLLVVLTFKTQEEDEATVNDFHLNEIQEER